MTTKDAKSLRKFPRSAEARWERYQEINALLSSLNKEKEELKDELYGAFKDDREEAVRMTGGNILTRQLIEVPEAEIIRKAYSFWKYSVVKAV